MDGDGDDDGGCGFDNSSDSSPPPVPRTVSKRQAGIVIFLLVH